MEFDKIHFKLTDSLKGGFKVPKYGWVERRKRATPEPLYVLCARVCDYLPEEECFKWTNMHVLIWIEKLGFPQYRNTFFENMINGRTLLLVDAAALCHMNIKDFDHILIIAKAIRDLYKVEKILFNRSISLPPRYPDTHFKLFRVCTGPTYQRTTRTQLWQRMKLVQEFPPHRNHWISLHNYLQHKPNNQIHRIGYAPRFKLYGVKKGTDTLHDAPVSSIIMHKEDDCRCIPPCECKWNESDYGQTWTLSILKDIVDNDLESKVQEGDIIIASAEPVSAGSADTTQDIKTPEGINTNEEQEPRLDHCGCIVPHLCHWPKFAKKPFVLTVVRLYRSYMKSVGDELAFNCCCAATEK